MATVTEYFAGVNNSSNATYTVTCTANAAIGDLLVVIVLHDSNGTFTSFTDAPDGTNFTGNTYTQADQTNFTTSTRRAAIYFTVVTQALVGGTSKMRLLSGASTNKSIKVYKMTGANTISLDKIKNGTTANNQATTTTPISGTTLTTAQAVELAVALWAYEDTSSPTFTAPGGWTQTATTQQVLNGAAAAVSTAHQLLVATGTIGGTATLSVSETAGGCVATFKYADSGNQFGPLLNPGAVDVCANDMPGAYLVGPAGPSGSGQLPMVGAGT